ncbi:hypothetical protein BDBG_07741 [Blastomyces gilchristii SLH14081]|uniref:Uncharacterized protein n=1 Tax=Blastomyces gilchristii (strain SLH14081) TaxID=559298 RepID=A0A179UYV1_BLAGS|nr:uncharacterized protein BDBG_07741 [Blastomyces gilchristii SLH14081]OAT12399.1 hypothetical protein BDBG_07741 [Blastomyces gilchristii SLH14081]
MGKCLALVPPVWELQRATGDSPPGPTLNCTRRWQLRSAGAADHAKIPAIVLLARLWASVGTVIRYMLLMARGSQGEHITSEQYANKQTMFRDCLETQERRGKVKTLTTKKTEPYEV